MEPATDSWAAQQLAEFLAVVSSFPDEESATLGAVERAAEALEAEAGAVVHGEEVVAPVGFPVGEAPAAALIAVANDRRDVLEVPGSGPCNAVSVPLEGRPDSHMVLARGGVNGFAREEINLMRGMGRVLALALKMLRLLDDERTLREQSEMQAKEKAELLATLRERQTLLERLARIQRSIVRKVELEELLDVVVHGASELLGDVTAALLLIDGQSPSQMDLVASVGLSPEFVERTRKRPVDTGIAGRAIKEGRLVVVEDYSAEPDAIPELVADQMKATMAAPVHENMKVVGCLAIGSRDVGRSYSPSEQEVLLAFAEHASLALTDARNFGDAMHQAFHDGLTGLPNRALFLDRMDHALKRARRVNGSVAVLFLDLDRFKNVNDSLGHGAGDELLIAVARRLEQSLRPSDTAARFGGDEFAVLLEDLSDERDSMMVARRLLSALEAPFAVGGKDVFVSASVGIASTRDDDDLLRNADLAMYKAKSAGRGRYEVFEPGLHAAVVERLDMEGDLQRAVDREEFFLLYQPIVSLRTGKIVGVEGLLRWQHPERGVIPPVNFIPLAEETGLIVPLGAWVVTEACRQAAIWRRKHPSLAICVNISPKQLQHPGMIDGLHRSLRETGLDPRSLILEMTESVLMHDTEGAIAKLSRLKELGVQLAVDDFGTGYSSLQYLRRFPIDILKIAKSFVDGIGGASDESALARAIIDLGESFQLRIVAEGIETQAQLDRLLELGCDLGQGFLFAKPMDVAGVDALLAEAGETEAWPTLKAGGQAPTRS